VWLKVHASEKQDANLALSNVDERTVFRFGLHILGWKLGPTY